MRMIVNAASAARAWATTNENTNTTRATATKHKERASQTRDAFNFFSHCVEGSPSSLFLYMCQGGDNNEKSKRKTRDLALRDICYKPEATSEEEGRRSSKGGVQFNHDVCFFEHVAMRPGGRQAVVHEKAGTTN